MSGTLEVDEGGLLCCAGRLSLSDRHQRRLLVVCELTLSLMGENDISIFGPFGAFCACFLAILNARDFLRIFLRYFWAFFTLL